MANDNHILLLLLGLALCVESGSKEGLSYKPKEVGIGVILDMSSRVGGCAKEYISMAVSNFYAVNPNYQTKLAFSWKDSYNDDVLAAAAALELINEEEIHAIIGPQRSTEAKFIINLGEKAKIPIISFSATSPFLSPHHNPFFIRTAQDGSSQVAAIAAIVELFKWREVVLIYEDTEYGNGLIPFITDAFQKIDTRVSYRSVIPPSPNNETKILEELRTIRARETRVLLAHMTASLGQQLFKLAKKLGMMSEAFAWIITDGLSTLLDPMDENVIKNSMQGVLGVRPYVPKKTNQRFQDFENRWKKKMNNSEINMFGLWAYDTVWALAKAVELVSKTNSSVLRKNIGQTVREEQPLGLRVSESGPMILKTLIDTRFKGISGTFHLKKGQLRAVDYEIINVVGKSEGVIGNWSAKNEKILLNKKSITWPGGKKEPPKGWEIPISGHKLRIGVPVRDGVGFEEFFKLEWDSHNKPTNFSGFSYEIFNAAKKKMPFEIDCQFIPYVKHGSKTMAGTYDDLLQEIKAKKYDAVIKDDRQKNIWIFLKPQSWDLWLTTGVAFVVTGFIIWVLEHRTNTEFRGPPDQQLSTIFWFSFSTLVFAHRERVMNNWSRFVLIIWIFVVLIITQSYTASLASLLTVQRLQPAVVDVRELIRNNASVGYQSNSYVKNFLITQLNFKEDKLKAYSSPQEYDEALSKGSKNDGVDAIVDDIPCINLFLSKYCSKYVKVGPTYKSDGFGFAFPRGSPLVPYISRGILNVTQDYKFMQNLEKKYFGDKTTCQDQSSTSSSSDGASLSVYSFGGLFIITGLTSIGSCLIYLIKFHRKHWPAVNAIHPESSIWSKLTQIAKHYDTKDNNNLPSNNNAFNRSSHDDRSNVIEGEISLVINGANLQSRSMSSGHGTHVEEEVLSMEDSGRFIYGGA
ncbi:hypothetical protein UlMin_004207 [Ulmus minor]